MTRLATIAIISLLSICGGLMVCAQDADTAAITPPKLVLRSSTGAGRVTTNRLTLKWRGMIEAERYHVWAGTNDNDLSWREDETKATTYTFEFTNAWRQRPAMWFFGVASVIGQAKSELIYAHWPAYPQVLSFFLLTWDEINTVVIEASDDLQEWAALPAVHSDHLIVPARPGNRFLRDAAGVVALRIQPIFTPDPRDIP